MFLLLSGFCLPTGHAEEVATTTPEVQEVVPESLKSPRATMETFLKAMNDIKRGNKDRLIDAIETLDLSGVNKLIRNERGKDLAWMLLEVLDRTRKITLSRIPAGTKGKPWVFKQYQHGSIFISRTSQGRWLFASDTMRDLPAIWDEVSDKEKVTGVKESAGHIPLHLQLRGQLPNLLKDVYFLLENWQWIGLLTIIFVIVLGDKLITLFLRSFIRRWRARSRREAFKNISDEMLRPFGLLFMSGISWAGINLLGLPEQAMLVLLVGVKFIAAVSAVWASYRMVDLVGFWLIERAAATETRLDDAIVPLVPKVLKIFVTVIGIIFIADNLNINITGLLAGLGLGGLAFALAAKDMVQNIFGSITILLDRTFSVGDWIIVGDQEGTVERIGFRSTRVRTFYNSVVTIPNSHFITANVDNMGDRRFRRLSATLGLTYDTSPDKIEAFCEGVRELVRQHPYMRKDYYHVYFNGYGASGLEILVYVFWETPDWSTELRERHRFLLDILRLASQLGVEFAYPTQTLFMKQDQAPMSGEEISQARAFDQGRDQAKSIVDGTTGLGVRPPPVSF